MPLAAFGPEPSVTEAGQAAFMVMLLLPDVIRCLEARADIQPTGLPIRGVGTGRRAWDPFQWQAITRQVSQMMNSAETSTPRRGFLNMLLGTGTVATLGAILYPIFRFMVPPKVVESSTATVTAAKVAEIKPNQGKIFKFGSKPGLLVQTLDGEYRAFSAICTHLDCTVQYKQD